MGLFNSTVLFFTLPGLKFFFECTLCSDCNKLNYYTYISIAIKRNEKRSLIFLFFYFPHTICHLRQNTSPAFTEKMKAEMREKVKEAVRHAWQGYKQYAWGADDLKPLTKRTGSMV